jgi:hypothetical protein
MQGLFRLALGKQLDRETALNEYIVPQIRVDQGNVDSIPNTVLTIVN